MGVMWEEEVVSGQAGVDLQEDSAVLPPSGGTDSPEEGALTGLGWRRSK